MGNGRIYSCLYEALTLSYIQDKYKAAVGKFLSPADTLLTVHNSHSIEPAESFVENTLAVVTAPAEAPARPGPFAKYKFILPGRLKVIMKHHLVDKVNIDCLLERRNVLSASLLWRRAIDIIVYQIMYYIVLIGYLKK